MSPKAVSKASNPKNNQQAKPTASVVKKVPEKNKAKTKKPIYPSSESSSETESDTSSSSITSDSSLVSTEESSSSESDSSTSSGSSSSDSSSSSGSESSSNSDTSSSATSSSEKSSYSDTSSDSSSSSDSDSSSSSDDSSTGSDTESMTSDDSTSDSSSDSEGSDSSSSGSEASADSIHEPAPQEMRPVTPTGSTLFVGNLPFTATKESLSSLFSRHGSVASVRIITDQRTGKPKGFAYVTFDHPVDKILNLNLELDGRQLRLDRSQERGERPQSSSAPTSPSNSTPTPTLFVGNLAFSVSESALHDAFSKFGEIISCRIPTNSEDGRSRGYGFVQFASTEEAQAAYNAPRFEIDGRFLRLDFDNPNGGVRKREFGDRGDRGDRGGRGGRGRGGRGRGSPSTNKHQRYFD